MIGIEICRQHVNMVVIKAIGSQFKILEFDAFAIPPEAFDEKHHLRFEELTQLLKSIRKSLKTRSRKLAITIPDSFVMEKVVHIEKGFDYRDKEFAIQQAFAKLTPIAIEELNLDFTEIETDKHKGNHTHSFQVYASKKEWSDFHCNAAKMAGFTPVFLDSKTHALSQVVRLMCKHYPQKMNWTLIDVGSTQTTLCLSTKQSEEYVKNIPIGHSTTTRLDNAISELGARYEGSEDIAGELLELDLANSITDLTTRLLRELQLYKSIQAIEDVGGVWISGNCSVTAKLSQSLNQSLAVKCKPLDIVALIEADQPLSEKETSHLAVATGIAINAIHWGKQKHD